MITVSEKMTPSIGICALRYKKEAQWLLVTSLFLSVVTLSAVASSMWVQARATDLWDVTLKVERGIIFFALPTKICMTVFILCVLNRKSFQSQNSEKLKAASSTLDMVSPFPGKCVSLLVKEGMRVQKGEILCEMEVMKMFSSLRAPKNGTVTKVWICVGQIVDAKTLLLRLES